MRQFNLRKWAAAIVSGTLGGAASGAVIGSFLPGPGTLVGALGGAATGFIGGVFYEPITALIEKDERLLLEGEGEDTAPNQIGTNEGYQLLEEAKELIWVAEHTDDPAERRKLLMEAKEFADMIREELNREED